MAPTSASSQEWEDLTLPLSGMDSDASPRSNGTNTAPASSSDTGPTSPDGEMYTTSPLLPTPHAEAAGWTPDEDQDPAHRPYQNGQHRSWGVKQVVETLMPTPTAGDASQSGHRQEERSPSSHAGTRLSDWARNESTSSSGDTPASPSAPPDGEREPMILAISGLSSPVSLASFDPEACCWRTFQATLDLEQPRFSQTLPRSGMTRHGQLFELRMSVRPIAASDGSASLPTLLHSPTASDSDGKPRYDHRASPGYVRAKPVPNLAAQVIDELLPTPDATHGRKDSRTARMLPGVVEDLMPTPSAWLGRRPSSSAVDPARKATGNSAKGEQSKELIDAIGDLLPTPRTSDVHGTGKHGTGGKDLRTSVGELTDPPSNDGNE